MESLERYLSIDIGFVKPGITLILQNKETQKITIEVFENIKFNTVLDSILILDYFFSQKITTLILEQQIVNKNISLMQFMHGYALGKGVKVTIKRPISFLREKVPGEKVTRTIKKKFSVIYLNNLLEKNKICKQYVFKDSDICDAINIGLAHIYSLNKKNINNVDIKIDKIEHSKLELG